jgi:hypothetical protein
MRKTVYKCLVAIVYVFVILGLYGCSNNKWVKSSGSQYGLNSDISECKGYASSLAENRFPDRQKEYGYNCGGYSDMTRGYGSTTVNCQPHETQSSSRNRALDSWGKVIVFQREYNKCMRGKGWMKPHETINSSAAKDVEIEMECYTSYGCDSGKHCRSKIGGGTECR